MAGASPCIGASVDPTCACPTFPHKSSRPGPPNVLNEFWAPGVPSQDFMTADERTSGEAVGVLVRSGAHEVDLFRRLSRPCYFPANSHRVLRGAWFAEKGGEWVPLKVGGWRWGSRRACMGGWICGGWVGAGAVTGAHAK